MHCDRAGRELIEVSLSGGSDTSDLLGGFEQQDPQRAVQVPSIRVLGFRVSVVSVTAIITCMNATVHRLFAGFLIKILPVDCSRDWSVGTDHLSRQCLLIGANMRHALRHVIPEGTSVN